MASAAMAATANEPAKNAAVGASSPSPKELAGGGLGERTRSIKVVQEKMLPHLEKIFQAHAGPDKKWSREQTAAFLNGIQHSDPEDPNGLQLLAQDEVDFHKFLGYMTSSSAALTTPPKPTDLSWPLSSYFISSSHNTYLSGNQLSSDSTTETYTDVLLRGCRCVEIDVWDGEYDSSSSSSSSSSDDEKAQAKAQKAKAKAQAKAAAEADASADGKAGAKSGDGDGDGDPVFAKPKRRSTFGALKQKITRSLSTRLKRPSPPSKKAENPDGSPGALPASDSNGTSISQDIIPEPMVEEPVVIDVEPLVYHGYTLTKEITFRDVCVAVRKSAFAVYDTPLIVSLEVHCSPAQQLSMVKIMKETWGDVLLQETDVEPPVLPSPGELRNKILVKVKYSPPAKVASVEAAQPTAEIAGESKPLEGSTDSGTVEEAKPEAVEAKPSEGAGSVKKPEEVKQTKEAKEGKEGKAKAPKTIQELSRMGVYTKGVTFKGFSQPEATMPTHVFSLPEIKFYKHHMADDVELWEHNKRFLMRAYPAGFRVKSQNLDPACFWGAGAQLVALNWQGTDKSMMMNEAMFAGTGGYVLKPPGFHPPLEGRTTVQDVVTRKLALTITFLAAQNIPLPLADSHDRSFRPYIKMAVYPDASEGLRGGHIQNEGLEREDEYKAKTRKHKGCNIDMGGEKLELKDIPGVVDELTFVRFTIRDDEIGKDDLAAWACVRLDRLGVGYRFIHLFDAGGKMSDGAVLVKVEKKLE